MYDIEMKYQKSSSFRKYVFGHIYLYTDLLSVLLKQENTYIIYIVVIISNIK